MKETSHSKVLLGTTVAILIGAFVIYQTQQHTPFAEPPKQKKIAQPQPTIESTKSYTLTGMIVYNKTDDPCTKPDLDSEVFSNLNIEVLAPSTVPDADDISLGTVKPTSEGNFSLAFNGKEFASGVFSVHISDGQKLVFVSDTIGSGVTPDTCHASILNVYRSPFAVKEITIR